MAEVLTVPILLKWKDVEAYMNQHDIVEVVRCKDCKHFEYNHWEKVNGVPLIVAHEICKRWGDGCKTREDGFCFIGERKEAEDGRPD